MMQADVLQYNKHRTGRASAARERSDNNMDYTIQKGNLSLTASTHGAELCSLTLDGQERIWDANPVVWARHAPMCFPICGWLEEGYFLWNGKRYDIPERHGFLRDQEHTLVEKTEDTLRFHFAWQGDAKRWPWTFSTETEHQLKADGAVTTCTAVNQSDEPMPVQFGFHPAFVCPFVADSKIEEYQYRFESGRVIPLTPHLFDNDSIPFEDAGAWVRLEYVPTGKYLQVETAAFPVVLIWSKPGIPGFVCIEPWNGFPGPGTSLEARPHTELLAPGERKSWSLEISFG